MSPDFYLSSSEGYGLSEPRLCRQLRRLRTASRDDLLLVRIEPVIIGQAYGLGGVDIDQVVLATRHVGASLFPISDWPVYVHVARLLVDLGESRDFLAPTELEAIAWAELYPTEQSARAKGM